MSLPRKDVRLKLDHDIHAACAAIAESVDMLPAEWCEQVMVGIITKRVHEASLMIGRLEASGSLGTFRDEPA